MKRGLHYGRDHNPVINLADARCGPGGIRWVPLVFAYSNRLFLLSLREQVVYFFVR